MKNEILNYMKQRAKYWWASMIVGIIAIVLSIWCLFTPGETLIAITYAFMVGLFISGIIDIVSAISNRKSMPGWGWGLAGGIIDILFGILLVVLPLPIVTTILIYLVGFWILFRSAWTIGIAAELNHYMNAGWLIVFSVLSLVFSIFYLTSPAFGGIAIIALVSVAFMFYGIFRIYYSLKLRSLNKKFKQDKI